jgi:ComF family protein
LHSPRTKPAEIREFLSAMFCICSEVFKAFFSGVVIYLMPPKCLACRDLIWGKGGLCSICWQKCTFIKDICCITCGRFARHQGLICGFCIKDRPHYECARSLINFNFVSKGFIHDLKYRDRTDLIHFFAKLLAGTYADFIKEVDLIIPVPMHYLRRIMRSYNQAHILAFSLARYTNKPFAPFILKKSRFTSPQTLMNKKERKQNLKNSFSIANAEELIGKKILLVDDVMTTGSTVNICSQALKKAGAKSVRVLTIASVR